jgi:hypothetical protein
MRGSLLPPVVAALLFAHGMCAAEDPFRLQLLNDPTSEALNAVCLDGSPGAFYIKLATPGFETSWQFYMEGGGWCWSAQDCAARATTALGSSDGYSPTIPVMGGGIVSSNCEVNPTFCNFNQVLFKYCDGNSFSGQREDSLPIPPAATRVSNRTGYSAGAVEPNIVVANASRKVEALWFRGTAIVEATLQVLQAQFGLASATEVLLTGCSAGGLASFLQADRVGDFLTANTPPGLRYKVAPVSGFFLQQDNVVGQSVYQEQVQSIFALSNAVAGVNQECVAAFQGEEWRCNFAGPAYAHTRAAVMVIDSSIDSWQTACILTAAPGNGGQNCAAVEGWEFCGASIPACNSTQMFAMIGNQAAFVTQVGVRYDHVCLPAIRAWLTRAWCRLTLHSSQPHHSFPCSRTTPLCTRATRTVVNSTTCNGRPSRVQAVCRYRMLSGDGLDPPAEAERIHRNFHACGQG